MSYPALQDDYGFLQICVHSAHILFPSDAKPISGFAYADVMLANSTNSTIIRRGVKPNSNIFNPNWDSILEMRCCRETGEASAFVVVQYVTAQGDEFESIYIADGPLTIGKSISKATYILRESGETDALNAAPAGSIILSIDYFPNHQSLKCLAEDCIEKESLLESLSQELLSILLRSGDDDDDKDREHKEKKEEEEDEDDSGSRKLIRAVRRLLDLIRSRDTILSYLLMNLISPPTSLPHPPSSSSASSSASYFHPSQPSASLPLVLSSIPARVALSKVAACLLAFLKSLSQSLPHSPRVTISLVEKIIHIFCLAEEVGRKRKGGSNSSDKDKDKGKSKGKAGARGSAEAGRGARAEGSEHLSWFQLQELSLISFLWLLQQSFVGAGLLAEFPITARELEALRIRFEGGFVFSSVCLCNFICFLSRRLHTL